MPYAQFVAQAKSREKGECRLVNDRFLRRQGASTLWVRLLRSDTVTTYSEICVVISNCDGLCWIRIANGTVWLCHYLASAVV